MVEVLVSVMRGRHASEVRAEDDPDAAAVLAREVEAGILDGLGRGDQGHLGAPRHLGALRGADLFLRLEALKLRGPDHPMAGRIEGPDRPHAIAPFA
jgi:hypothetical protein